MRTLRTLLAVAAVVLLAVPATGTARPCVGDVCVPQSDPLERFCAIADGPIVQIICRI